MAKEKRSFFLFTFTCSTLTMHLVFSLLSQVVWVKNTLEQNGSQIEVRQTDFQEQLDETSERLNGRLKRDVNDVFNVSDFNR